MKIQQSCRGRRPPAINEVPRRKWGAQKGVGGVSIPEQSKGQFWGIPIFGVRVLPVAFIKLGIPPGEGGIKAIVPIGVRTKVLRTSF